MMKKVINVALASSSFSIDEDAYARLSKYLGHFRNRLMVGPAAIPAGQVGEVMEDLEQRLSELFGAEIAGTPRVVNLEMVEKVIAQLGMPDGSPETGSENRNPSQVGNKAARKIYRDKAEGRIAGVCSGLAWYFNLDVVLFRVLFLVLLFTVGSGLLLYLILWVAIPKADTPAQRCEMKGLSPTAENLSKETLGKATE